MTAITTPDRDEQMKATTGDAAFEKLTSRLNKLSVERGHDAFADIAWDDPDMAIDPHDPRFVEAAGTLADTSWFQRQPPTVQARIGLTGIATSMQVGTTFERVLSRGLLLHIDSLPAGSLEGRYAYHEVIEESQHSLMFQEFVRRSGIDVPRLGRFDAFRASRVAGMAKWFPELFFLFVLGGEDPIDYAQKESLRTRDNLHPLVERIMRIHVAEEARHLSFARNYLRLHVPKLSKPRRAVLAIATPLLLREMASMMLEPSSDLIKTFEIPAEVIDEAFTNNEVHQRSVQVSIAKLRELCDELGLMTRPATRLWRQFNLVE